MRISVRQGVFETNSSSVHSCVVMSKEDFDRWRDEETRLYLDMVCDDEHRHHPRLLTFDEALEERVDAEDRDELLDSDGNIDREKANEYLRDYHDIVTYGDFGKSYDGHYPQHSSSFVMPSGETVVSCCYFGEDR